MRESAPWTRKHQPASTKEIVGQENALAVLRRFVSDYKRQKKRALLLYGPAGSGKTSSAYAIAGELGLEVVEVNASDVRNQESINSVLGAALKQRSLVSKGKVVLIDEMDGIAGREDRGGLSAIVKLVSESSFPVVITANNPFEKKFSALRKKAELVEFKKLSYHEVHSALDVVCKKERITCEGEALKALAVRSGGDIRGAINDMQLLAHDTRTITKEEITELFERNREESMTVALLKVFKNSDLKVAVEAFSNVNEDLNEAMLWVDENLPKEYTLPEDIARAYEAMSKADVFNGRIRRQQYWRLLTYVNDLLAGGVAVAKQKRSSSAVEYKQTSRILKLYIANMRFMKRKAIAQKIAEKTHSSAKEVIKSTMPYIKIIFRNNREAARQITEEFELDREEVEWLKR